ncbi:tRNA glutamyl-Q(34) synthetase GluQRS [Corticibacterium sp. UT-5YL-CI-8]|nr:tRNA glutamyl-Q(34) synthetase GluQRS [Tianweitania sp. UT-5YL-CI-8]
MNAPVFRFAPSPNGEMHLGHAFSALVNAGMAVQTGGRLLLRIEDIDVIRCTPDFEAGIHRDLAWLGVAYECPVRRQSEHFDDYRAVLDRLIADDLVYPSFLSRGAVRAVISEQEAGGTAWPRDPDGAPLHPPMERFLSQAERGRRIAAGEPFAWRLDVDKAYARVGKALDWTEWTDETMTATRRETAAPQAWGDVIMARKEAPTTYHLSVVVDDALQGITHVVRGRDLFHATSIQRLLQELLGLPQPTYFHHRLILDAEGRKLSKSFRDTGLKALRDLGRTPADIRDMLGF